MFKKKNCKKCGKKSNKDYEFCPYCGNFLSKKENDFGLLGKKDSQEDFKLPPGLNMLFNSLMKNLDKQLKNLDNESKSIKKGFSINISTKQGNHPEIKISSHNPNPQQVQELEEEIPSKHFSSKQIKEFSKLKKQEPKTEIKRFSDKIVYELSVPEVKSIEDVSIIRFENSIEVKALGNNTGYSKIIPVSFPLKNYYLIKDKLILELEETN